MLERLGFVWDSHALGWEERWYELKEFKQKYGHCSVPKNYAANLQLAVWVKVSTALAFSACIVVVLACIRRCGSLSHHSVSFRYATTNTTVEQYYHQCQRRQYKLYSEGKESNMSRARIDKLASLGFDFTPRKQDSVLKVLPIFPPGHHHYQDGVGEDDTNFFLW
jgi:hypothetical protein